MSFVLLGILNSQAAGGGAGGPAYDFLETTTLGADTSSVTFTGLLAAYGADYKHLEFRMSIKSTRPTNNVDGFLAQLNNDASANYSLHQVRNNSGGLTAAGASGLTGLDFGNIQTNNIAAEAFSPSIVLIQDAFSTSKNKTSRKLTGMAEVAQSYFGSSAWYSTSAIDSVTLFATTAGSLLKANSRISIYGIKG